MRNDGRNGNDNTSPRGRPLARFEACPKCRGQYLRDGWTCHCYQCCFEWDLRDPIPDILVRARRMYRGEAMSDPPDLAIDEFDDQKDPA